MTRQIFKSNMMKSVLLVTFSNGFHINRFYIMLEKIVFALGIILAKIFRRNSLKLSRKKIIEVTAAAARG